MGENPYKPRPFTKEDHEYYMDHVDGYKGLIEGGLTPEEANEFIALACTDELKVLDQEGTRRLEELRNKWTKK